MHMKTRFKIAAFALLVTTIILYLPVMRDGGYHYDQHGYYTGSDGVLRRESEAEKNFFLFLFSLMLLLLTAFLGFKKSRVRTQLK